MPKTVRDLTSEELRAYRPWTRVVARLKDPERDRQRERSWGVARASARLLKEHYGVKRVVVFGSLLSEEGFTPWSDVDLAVSGLKPARYYDAVGAVLDLGVSAGVEVDVVDLDTCPDKMRRAVETRGVVL